MFSNIVAHMLILECLGLLKSRFCRCVDLLGTGVDLARIASPISFHDE
jgi:hypothetical protein